MTNGKIPPKYNVAIVEAVILEVAAELHPEHLSAHELSLKTISDPDDSRELETAALAIAGLRDSPRSRVYALTSARRIPVHRDGSALIARRSELDSWLRAGGGRRP
jgi:hypothetical protein